MSDLPIKLVNRQIDYDLAAALGQAPSDFLVLCLDGVPVDGFGTPRDGVLTRMEFSQLATAINQRDSGGTWLKFWNGWSRQIIATLKLPKDARAEEVCPVASVEVHRVAAAYSEHLHCAIRLFEEPKVVQILDRYEVFWGSESSRCKIVTKDGRTVECEADLLSLTVASAVLALLKSEPVGDGEVSR